ncbi:MAG: glycosyltransferase family 4 protein [Melioribacteraceae bacterium]|nr:glycosyltransferase family 4 protein [Melioribacteraceae bacterium]
MSKKVLLIPDLPNWALHKNAKDLVKYNKSNLDLEIVIFNDFMKDWEKYYKEYDLLFPMYKGIFFPMLKAGIPHDKVITGIRSYHRWDHRKTRPPGYNTKPSYKIIRKMRKALLVNTHCKKLWYIFSQYFPVVHTKYTCDLEMFYPEERKPNDKIVVGWTGSLTNHPGKRGFEEFIKPITDEIPGIELKVQASEDKQITDDNEMREFYNSLDLYIVASRSEGTPRPIIESAACGIPSISTDVGIVPELIEDGVNGFVVDRNYDVIKSKLEWIAANREILPKMGNLIRKKMEEEFNWDTLIYQWTDFLYYSLELKKLKRSGVMK